MDKKMIPFAVVLFVLLMFWPQICAKYFPGAVPPEPVPAETPADPQTPAVTSAAPVTAVEDPVVEQPVSNAAPVSAAPAAPAPQPAVVEKPEHAAETPELASISNELIDLTVSSWGGGIVSATLKQYPTENKPDSPPVVLDFSAMPTLALDGIPGMSTNYDFSVSADSGVLRVSRQTGYGLKFERTIELTDAYELKVTDTMSNASQDPLSVPEFGLHVGPMGKVDTSQMRRTFVYLGIDSRLTQGGDDIRHWGSGKKLEKHEVSLVKLFDEEGRRGSGCTRPPMTRPMPPTITQLVKREVDWLAVKNKYFAQILTPVMPSENPSPGAFIMRASREVPEIEELEPGNTRGWAKRATLEEVNATVIFPAHPRPLGPGQSITREMNYYVGPKKYDLLKRLNKSPVMEFGFWTPVCELLLPILNYLYIVIPNYGWAIIVMTIMIRLVFWPIMKKQTDTMKKMQEVQPQLQELREKYKDDQQELYKRQQALFKEHGVSPLGGCLPMLIQIPVFIGLLTVLRSAIELRFASWLWIKDLSASEGLFAPNFPLVGELNILPLLMTATMIWQQKLTPSTGDQQQQKMMMIFMPVMLLVFFYKMPAASVLYFTVSQCLGIFQLIMRTRGDKKKDG